MVVVDNFLKKTWSNLTSFDFLKFLYALHCGKERLLHLLILLRYANNQSKLHRK
jgi:hypothetical protein